MYIQLTTRCNMECDHCCFACTSEGIDISVENYDKALAITEALEEYLTIGGGEPTLHPHFIDFVKKAVFADLGDGFEEYDFFKPLIVTNGSVTKTALKLAQWTKKGLVSAELSQDNYHDSIDWEVEKAFEDLGKTRNVTGGEKQQGRAEDWGVYEGCACNTIFISPNGDFKACGCLDSPVLFNISDYSVQECLDKIYTIREEYENFGQDCHKDLELNEDRKVA